MPAELSKLSKGNRFLDFDVGGEHSVDFNRQIKLPKQRVLGVRFVPPQLPNLFYYA